MTSQVSRPVEQRGFTGELRHLVRFLRRPALPDRATGPGAGPLGRVLVLFLIDMAIMIPLVLIALSLEAAGFQFPDNALEDLEFDAQTILLIVLAIPLVEEIAFRGWLSGRPGHLAAYAVLIAAIVVLSVGAAAPVAVKGVVIGMTIAFASYWLWKLRHKPALRWFQRHFLWFFALSTLLFAFIHVFNYEGEVNVLFLLPLVIPQFITGVLLAYTRVQLGFWACVLLHAMHNGTLVAAVVAFNL